MDFSRIQQRIEQGAGDWEPHRNESSSEVEKLLTDITKESQQWEAQLNGELETARRVGMEPAHIQELEKKLESVRQLNAENIKDFNLRLERAQEREQEQAKREEALVNERAAKVRDELKGEMKHAWLQSGGDVAGFEEAWPQIYQAEMTKRAQAAHANAHKESVRSIRDIQP